MTPTTPTTPTDLASRRRAMQLEAQRRFDLAGLPAPRANARVESWLRIGDHEFAVTGEGES